MIYMGLILEMKDIQKSFPGVRALKDVTFSVEQSEVHGLVGENGAGKSTLMKILSGAYERDEGQIIFEGRPIEVTNPHHMIELGIAVIYQEMTLAPHLTVGENIYLGRLPRNRYGFIDWEEVNKKTKEVGHLLGLSLNPKTIVKTLSVAQRQMVEIAKALTRDAKLIVLDEPSAVLNNVELEGLFNVIRRLTKQGVSFIYISHRLEEVFEITNRVTVMKDGQVVGTDATENLNANKLVSMMVGRKLSEIYPKRENTFGKKVLKVSNLTRKGVIQNINLDVREGEIVALAGLAGSGRTEVLRAIVGADKIDSGSIEINGEKCRIASPRDAIKNGIGILPEDRKTEGLFLKQLVGFNITIAKLGKVLRQHFLNSKIENTRVDQFIHQLDVRPKSGKAYMKNLSGGNQQKCVLAKWLNAECKILLVDEPTRGVDVGAKQEIYQVLNELTKQGTALIVVSSELPEVLGISDRILVMHDGEIVTELKREEASEELIMQYATGQAG